VSNGNEKSNSKTNIHVYEPILAVVLVFISSWHSGHTILIGYSPKVTVTCFDDSAFVVMTLDGD